MSDKSHTYSIQCISKSPHLPRWNIFTDGNDLPQISFMFILKFERNLQTLVFYTLQLLIRLCQIVLLFSVQVAPILHKYCIKFTFSLNVYRTLQIKVFNVINICHTLIWQMIHMCIMFIRVYSDLATAQRITLRSQNMS